MAYPKAASSSLTSIKAPARSSRRQSSWMAMMAAWSLGSWIGRSFCIVALLLCLRRVPAPGHVPRPGAELFERSAGAPRLQIGVIGLVTGLVEPVRQFGVSLPSWGLLRGGHRHAPFFMSYNELFATISSKTYSHTSRDRNAPYAPF